MAPVRDYVRSRRTGSSAISPIVPVPVSRPATGLFHVLRDGQLFAEHRRRSSAFEHRDYMISTADGHDYEVVEVRS